MTALHAVLVLMLLTGLTVITIRGRNRNQQIQRVKQNPGGIGPVSSSWTEIMTTLLGGENIALDQHPWDQELFRASREDLSIVLDACFNGIQAMERLAIRHLPIHGSAPPSFSIMLASISRSSGSARFISNCSMSSIPATAVGVMPMFDGVVDTTGSPCGPIKPVDGP